MAFLIAVGVFIYFIINGRPWDIWVLPLAIAIIALFSLWIDYRIWRNWGQKEKKGSRKGKVQNGGWKVKLMSPTAM